MVPAPWQAAGNMPRVQDLQRQHRGNAPMLDGSQKRIVTHTQGATPRCATCCCSCSLRPEHERNTCQGRKWVMPHGWTLSPQYPCPHFYSGSPQLLWPFSRPRWWRCCYCCCCCCYFLHIWPRCSPGQPPCSAFSSQLRQRLVHDVHQEVGVLNAEAHRRPAPVVQGSGVIIMLYSAVRPLHRAACGTAAI